MSPDESRTAFPMDAVQGENRRTRRARIDTGPQPSMAPPQAEPERDLPAWEVAVQAATQATPAWEPVSAPVATPSDEPMTLDALLTQPDPEASPTPAAAPPRKPQKTGKQPKSPKPEKSPRDPKPEKPAKPTKTAKAPKPKADQLPIGGVPKVDLLPPELKQARAWRAARGRALVFILCATMLMLAGVGGATWWAQSKVEERNAAQARTDELLAMQSEFVEVNQVQGAIRSAEGALTQAAATDVVWRDLLAELQRTLPPGTRITTLTIEAGSPTTELAAPTDPLRSTRIASVTFTAVATSVPDVVSWTRAVLDVPGIVYAAPRSTIADEASTSFTVEMSVDVSAERLRNLPEDAAAADAETEEDGQ